VIKKIIYSNKILYYNLKPINKITLFNFKLSINCKLSFTIKIIKFYNYSLRYK